MTRLGGLLCQEHPDGATMQVAEWLLQALGSGNWWLAVAAVITLTVLRSRRLLDDFDWFLSRRVRLLEWALDSKFLDPSSRKVLEDQVRGAILHRALGRRIDPITIGLIAQLNQVVPLKLTTVDLLAASRFVRVDVDGLPSIQIKTSDKVDHVINTVIGMTCTVGAALVPVLLWVWFMRKAPAEDLIGVGAWALLSICGFAYAYVESRPYFSARRIASDVASATEVLRQLKATEVQSNSPPDSPPGVPSTDTPARRLEVVAK
jgi:hypothetical protein